MHKNIGCYAGGGCCCGLVCLILGLALATGGVFLSFYIGWSVQQSEFRAQNSALAGNYTALFAVPAVAAPWPVFSCFLYGALILAACGIGLVLLVMCLSCCGCPLLACCCSGKQDDGEWTELKMPSPSMRHGYNSFPKVSVSGHSSW
jgi:hypothetical protein